MIDFSECKRYGKCQERLMRLEQKVNTFQRCQIETYSMLELVRWYVGMLICCDVALRHFVWTDPALEQFPFARKL